MAPIRLAMAQTNPTVGAISHNLDACFDAVRDAAAAGASMVVFGEMVVTGYPIEDLAQRPSFVQEAEEAVLAFATRLSHANLGDICVVIGHPTMAAAGNGWAIASNSASVILRGQIIGPTTRSSMSTGCLCLEPRV
jgi:NAD+ synthase (glutamine-hydrolysing)